MPGNNQGLPENQGIAFNLGSPLGEVRSQGTPFNLG